MRCAPPSPCVSPPSARPRASDTERPTRCRRSRRQRKRISPAVAWSWPASLPCRAGRLGGVERGREPLLFAVVAGALPEPRPADARRAVPADDVSLRILAHQVVDENVLGDDDVAFHPDDLGDVGNPAGTVAQAGGLHDDVDRAANHLANGARGQRIAAHGDLALTLEIRGSGLEPHRVRLLQLQLGGILAGDDALVVLDEAGETVE